MNEQHLVFIMVNNSRQRRPASDQIARRKLAFEYGVLQMVAIATHGLEDLAKTLVIGDVVTDEIRLAHTLLLRTLPEPKQHISGRDRPATVSDESNLELRQHTTTRRRLRGPRGSIGAAPATIAPLDAN
jgi:hypothetical protein